MKKRTAPRRTLALLLSLVTLCSACGSPTAEESAMELMKAEGEVSVADESGNILPLQDNMRLHSGCRVSTEEMSCVWINLDEANLIKMDANSQIDIQKSGNQLEILVNSGSLFFYITGPLSDYETLTIRSSAMMAGIRNACGWVEAISPEALRVCILEGTAECTVPDLLSDRPLTSTVTGGGMAELAASFGASSITSGQFTESDIPVFVAEELNEDGTPNDTFTKTAGPDT